MWGFESSPGNHPHRVRRATRRAVTTLRATAATPFRRPGRPTGAFAVPTRSHGAMAYDLTDADLGQLEQRGISREEFERQLECFRRGFPPLEVVGPATPDHGIEV